MKHPDEWTDEDCDLVDFEYEACPNGCCPCCGCECSYSYDDYDKDDD